MQSILYKWDHFAILTMDFKSMNTEDISLIYVFLSSISLQTEWTISLQWLREITVWRMWMTSCTNQEALRSNLQLVKKKKAAVTKKNEWYIWGWKLSSFLTNIWMSDCLYFVLVSVSYLKIYLIIHTYFALACKVLCITSYN